MGIRLLDIAGIPHKKQTINIALTTLYHTKGIVLYIKEDQNLCILLSFYNCFQAWHDVCFKLVVHPKGI